MDMQSSKFDLITVSIDGEKVEARPIEWDEDTPILYMTTCPKCAQRVEFNPSQLSRLGDTLIGFCDECGVGKVQLFHVNEDASVSERPKPKPVEQEIETSEILFARDPIEAGVYVDSDVA